MKNKIDSYYIVTNQEPEKAFWLYQYGLDELYNGKVEAAVIHVYADAESRYIESAIFEDIPDWQDIANADIWEKWLMPDSEQVFYNFIDEMLSVLHQPDYQFEA